LDLQDCLRKKRKRHYGSTESQGGGSW
jgi:hypothetical protein